jgi:hypothetical protein
VLVVALAVIGSCSSQPEAATGRIVTASHGQCRARWSEGFGALRVHDADTEDHDRCYVRYGGEGEALGNQASLEQDEPGPRWFDLYRASLPGESVRWQVCKERQNDPDICSDVQEDEW